jgi:Zn-dependent protease with chaperone function
MPSSNHQKATGHERGQMFAGRFSDGATASSTAVEGELRQDGIIFWRTDAVAPVGAVPDEFWYWQYPLVETAQGLRARDPDVLMHYRDAPGASLFVEDRNFIRRLLQEADHTSSRAWLWRFTKPALAITAVLLAIVGTVWMFELTPSRTLAKMMPQNVRTNIGATLFASLTKGKRVCSSPDGDAALGKMVARLTRDHDAPFNVRVVNWPLENAFALPGGAIVITSGLIKGADTAEEVAGVLAHEIGHVVELHPETGVVRAMGLTVAAQFIFSGGAETLGGIGTLLVALRYNRRAEREADQVGLEILKSARVAPKPLAVFFDRMMKKHGVKLDTDGDKNDKDTSASSERSKTFERSLVRSLELFSTHPPTPERVKRINAAATYATEPVLDQADWKALQKVCADD